MLEKVKSAISRYEMLGRGEEVLVGLSGGADSTALLLSLIELGFKVRAIHVNHNLRGDESLRDQRFCEELCARLGISLSVESVDVSAYAAEKKLSVELAARELRYAAFEKHSLGNKIATAHTLSDSFETALLNLTRGCGVKGLCGIPPRRKNIIRPLIFCTRADVEAYLACKGQNFVTDSTNLSDDCSRNIIRLNVIPELERINPSLLKSFESSLCAISEAEAFIGAEAEKLLANFDGKAYNFTDIPDGAPLSAAVSRILSAEGVEPSYEKITAVKKIIFGGGRINVKKGVYLSARGGRLSVERDIAAPEEKRVTLGESFEIFGKSVAVTKISPFDISRFNKSDLRYMLDDSRVSGEYVARSFRGTERIRLPERGMSQMVKKLLCGLDPRERKNAVVIADTDGAVFVEGIGVSERVCCGANTRSALRIDISDAKGDGK